MRDSNGRDLTPDGVEGEGWGWWKVITSTVVDNAFVLSVIGLAVLLISFAYHFLRKATSSWSLSSSAAAAAYEPEDGEEESEATTTSLVRRRPAKRSRLCLCSTWPNISFMRAMADASVSLKACCVCSTPTKTKCSRCKSAYYCSPVCQKENWREHKEVCKDFAQRGKTAKAEVSACAVAVSNGSLSKGVGNGQSRVVHKQNDGRLGAHYTDANNNSNGDCVPIPEGGTLSKPKKFLYPYGRFQTFFDWEEVRGPPCGLINCGNSCFANVVLQCLTYTRPLAAYFCKASHKTSCRRQEWCFLCELQEHVQRALSSLAPISAVRIVAKMCKITNHLFYGRQEDAHEFMRFAIESMQSAFLEEAGGEKAHDIRTQETTLIHHIFGGYLQSQVKCLECKHQSNRYESILDLTVEIYGAVQSLEGALSKFTAREWLDGDNKYKCDRCNSYVRASKRLTVHEAPNVLTIALKRFQTGRFGKLNKWVAFPEVLDMSPYMSGEADMPPPYKLYAVIVHVDMLNASFFGHYVCFINHASGQWFKLDDSKVKEVSIDKVLSQKAYMLFYARLSPRPAPITEAGAKVTGREAPAAKLLAELPADSDGVSTMHELNSREDLRIGDGIDMAEEAHEHKPWDIDTSLMGASHSPVSSLMQQHADEDEGIAERDLEDGGSTLNWDCAQERRRIGIGHTSDLSCRSLVAVDNGDCDPHRPHHEAAHAVGEDGDILPRFLTPCLSPSCSHGCDSEIPISPREAGGGDKSDMQELVSIHGWGSAVQSPAASFESCESMEAVCGDNCESPVASWEGLEVDGVGLLSRDGLFRNGRADFRTNTEHGEQKPSNLNTQVALKLPANKSISHADEPEPSAIVQPLSLRTGESQAVLLKECVVVPAEMNPIPMDTCQVSDSSDSIKPLQELQGVLLHDEIVVSREVWAGEENRGYIGEEEAATQAAGSVAISTYSGEVTLGLSNPVDAAGIDSVRVGLETSEVTMSGEVNEYFDPHMEQSSPTIGRPTQAIDGLPCGLSSDTSEPVITAPEMSVGDLERSHVVGRIIDDQMNEAIAGKVFCTSSRPQDFVETDSPETWNEMGRGGGQGGAEACTCECAEGGECTREASDATPISEIALNTWDADKQYSSRETDGGVCSSIEPVSTGFEAYIPRECGVQQESTPSDWSGSDQMRQGVYVRSVHEGNGCARNCVNCGNPGLHRKEDQGCCKAGVEKGHRDLRSVYAASNDNVIPLEATKAPYSVDAFVGLKETSCGRGSEKREATLTGGGQGNVSQGFELEDDRMMVRDCVGATLVEDEDATEKNLSSDGSAVCSPGVLGQECKSSTTRAQDAALDESSMLKSMAMDGASPVACDSSNPVHGVVRVPSATSQSGRTSLLPGFLCGSRINMRQAKDGHVPDGKASDLSDPVITAPERSVGDVTHSHVVGRIIDDHMISTIAGRVFCTGMSSRPCPDSVKTDSPETWNEMRRGGGQDGAEACMRECAKGGECISEPSAATAVSELASDTVDTDKEYSSNDVCSVEPVSTGFETYIPRECGVRQESIPSESSDWSGSDQKRHSVYVKGVQEGKEVAPNCVNCMNPGPHRKEDQGCSNSGVEDGHRYPRIVYAGGNGNVNPLEGAAVVDITAEGKTLGSGGASVGLKETCFGSGSEKREATLTGGGQGNVSQASELEDNRIMVRDAAEAILVEDATTENNLSGDGSAAVCSNGVVAQECRSSTTKSQDAALDKSNMLKSMGTDGVSPVACNSSDPANGVVGVRSATSHSGQTSLLPGFLSGFLIKKTRQATDGHLPDGKACGTTAASSGSLHLNQDESLPHGVCSKKGNGGRAVENRANGPGSSTKDAPPSLHTAVCDPVREENNGKAQLRADSRHFLSAATNSKVQEHTMDSRLVNQTQIIRDRGLPKNGKSECNDGKAKLSRGSVAVDKERAGAKERPVEGGGLCNGSRPKPSAHDERKTHPLRDRNNVETQEEKEGKFNKTRENGMSFGAKDCMGSATAAGGTISASGNDKSDFHTVHQSQQLLGAEGGVRQQASVMPGRQLKKGAAAKQGRNQQCACGRGKKYKNCCGSPLKFV